MEHNNVHMLHIFAIQNCRLPLSKFIDESLGPEIRYQPCSQGTLLAHR